MRIGGLDIGCLSQMIQLAVSQRVAFPATISHIFVTGDVITFVFEEVGVS